MTVAEIARGIPGARLVGDGTVQVSGVTHDSRAVKEGFLFAALRGARTDGAEYIESAAEAGAAALMLEEPASSSLPQIIVGDAREELGRAAAVCYGDPTADLQVVGITGTNGKTTTAYLVEGAVAAVGGRPGVMSTVEYRFGERRWPAAHTTPEATVVQEVAREMADAGATHFIMEASSHGLALGRLTGCRFGVVAFTNLTQDHLDFHADMEDYGAAKLKLFTSAIGGNDDARVVVNIDDPFAARILESTSHPVITVSVDPRKGADLGPVEEPRYGIRGVEALVGFGDERQPLVSPLIGRHNLSNLMLALGICRALDIELARACAGLGHIAAIPGRLERVDDGGPFAVLVDYAHTPDALERVLGSLRPLTAGRLICVFGCGGDRDPAKRPLMGGAVARGADLAVVTSDNPRTEEPASIVEMILPGVEEESIERIDLGDLARAERGSAVELDRRRAIVAAVDAARPGDTVLIAGKGHEDYQILGTEKIHFDDREEARRALGRMGGGSDG